MRIWLKDWDNDTGSRDSYYKEWWTISDGQRTFRCDKEADADWLLETLRAAQLLSGLVGENA